MSLLFDAGEFERGLALWEAYWDWHPANAPAAPSRSGVSLYLPAALVYFGLGRYPATLQLVNRVLNTHQAFLSEKMPFAQWLRHKGTAPAVV